MGDKYCHFCGTSPDAVGQLVNGPRVLICSSCVRICSALVPDGTGRGLTVDHRPCGQTPPEFAEHLGRVPRAEYCNFCGKHQDEVSGLVRGYSRNICEECLELSRDILEEGRLSEVLS